eukprot:365103-Chlamydomonas_euryale.AAC.1
MEAGDELTPRAQKRHLQPATLIKAGDESRRTCTAGFKCVPCCCPAVAPLLPCCRPPAALLPSSCCPAAHMLHTCFTHATCCTHSSCCTSANCCTRSNCWTQTTALPSPRPRNRDTKSFPPALATETQSPSLPPSQQRHK